MRSGRAIAALGAPDLRARVLVPLVALDALRRDLGLGVDHPAQRAGVAVLHVVVLRDVVQIGARNMQNFTLLEAVGELRQPVLLKRGPSATLKEFLLAAEYIFARGNQQIILCERGIRTFETMTRNTLDLNAVPVLKQHSHLPVVVDPSHGVGLRSAVPAMARAAIAAGADGVLVECHPAPEQALSDGEQSLTLPEFAEMVRQLQLIAGAVGRST